MGTVYVERKRTKFLGLPICFVKYTVTEEKINIKKGFLNIQEDDAFLYKVQDVRLNRSFMERIFRLGTITCYTGDRTHPELLLIHIRHSEEIKDFLMEASEQARIKRRTLHTLNLDAVDIDEMVEEE